MCASFQLVFFYDCFLFVPWDEKRKPNQRDHRSFVWVCLRNSDTKLIHHPIWTWTHNKQPKKKSTQLVASLIIKLLPWKCKRREWLRKKNGSDFWLYFVRLCLSLYEKMRLIAKTRPTSQKWKSKRNECQHSTKKTRSIINVILVSVLLQVGSIEQPHRHDVPLDKCGIFKNQMKLKRETEEVGEKIKEKCIKTHLR